MRIDRENYTLRRTLTLGIPALGLLIAIGLIAYAAVVGHPDGTATTDGATTPRTGSGQPATTFPKPTAPGTTATTTTVRTTTTVPPSTTTPPTALCAAAAEAELAGQDVGRTGRAGDARALEVSLSLFAVHLRDLAAAAPDPARSQAAELGAEVNSVLLELSRLKDADQIKEAYAAGERDFGPQGVALFNVLRPGCPNMKSPG